MYNHGRQGPIDLGKFLGHLIKKTRWHGLSGGIRWLGQSFNAFNLRGNGFLFFFLQFLGRYNRAVILLFDGGQSLCLLENASLSLTWASKVAIFALELSASCWARFASLPVSALAC